LTSYKVIINGLPNAVQGPPVKTVLNMTTRQASGSGT
jgi:hypothetical protein